MARSNKHVQCISETPSDPRTDFFSDEDRPVKNRGFCDVMTLKCDNLRAGGDVCFILAAFKSKSLEYHNVPEVTISYPDNIRFCNQETMVLLSASFSFLCIHTTTAVLLCLCLGSWLRWRISSKMSLVT